MSQQGPQLTHSLVIPIATTASYPMLQRGLQEFRTRRATIRNRETGIVSWLDGRAIRPAGTLHLTIGVMSLQDSRKLQQAIQLLNRLDIEAMLRESSSTATSASPLSVSLRGLCSMHDPSRTSVLYVYPKDFTHRLRRLCEWVRDEFLKHGLMVESKWPFKLHVTIVNTYYAHDRNGRHPPIDARALLEHFKDFVWAEDVVLNRVAICEMGAKNVVDRRTGRVVDEAYTEVESKAIRV